MDIETTLPVDEADRRLGVFETTWWLANSRAPRANSASPWPSYELCLARLPGAGRGPAAGAHDFRTGGGLLSGGDQSCLLCSVWGGAPGRWWCSSRLWRPRRLPPTTRARPRVLRPRRSDEEGQDSTTDQDAAGLAAAPQRSHTALACAPVSHCGSPAARSQWMLPTLVAVRSEVEARPGQRYGRHAEYWGNARAYDS